MRQVPAPVAHGHLLALAAARGPRFVVLRVDEDAARAALCEHLVMVGAVGDVQDARALLVGAEAEPVEVVR